MKEIVCKKCNGEIDIFSVVLIDENAVKITFLCKECGEMFDECCYLYTEKEYKYFYKR